MRVIPRKFLVLLLLVVPPGPVRAQRDLAGAARTRSDLERLNVLGSLLMIGAHPDDENTALLAWFTRGLKIRTAYLSLTRGEGGQNLIGSEQGDLLGVIRTQELLAARRIDGAEQYFTRAIDFGFTKSAEETFQKWGKEQTLADVVWVIRTFRPDVIVLRFSGTPRDGHGQHQASGMLGKEAFVAAADRSRFPEQLKYVEPWQAKRLLWNTFAFTPQQERESARLPSRLEIDPGRYDPVLGYSYSEIAGMSRSMHRSQGMGAAERRGSSKQYLVHVAGEPASSGLFDGIDTSWGRVPGGPAVGAILARAAAAFDAAHPEKTVPSLLEARPLAAALKDPWAARKVAEIDEAAASCSGLWLDAATERADATPGSTLAVRATVLNRSEVPLELANIELEGPADGRAENQAGGPAPLPYNQPVVRTLSFQFAAGQPYTQPFWLAGPKQGDRYTIADQRLVGVADSPPVLRARFRIVAGSQTLELTRPVWYRYVDRVEGERTRPIAVAPPVALRLPEAVFVFPGKEPRTVDLELTANAAGVSGRASLEAPPGFAVEPRARPFSFKDAGEQAMYSFTVTPPASSVVASLRAVASIGGRETSSAMDVIAYPHIPVQTVFPPAEAKLVRTDIRVLAKRVGYVMGAGDDVPGALRQMGCEVSLLGADDLARGELSRFDAIVTGVRAYNTRPDLKANQHRLLGYVQGGGTLVVQYNTADSSLGSIGPFPLRIGRERVTVEEAPVTFPESDSPLLQSPNRITSADFEGWIQERGLYFASEWDPQYHALLESHDPGEPPHPGGTLYARYGKGTYVFTAYSWFRQLPAGVPGAFRIFANLLSAGKVLP